MSEYCFEIVYYVMWFFITFPSFYSLKCIHPFQISVCLIMYLYYACKFDQTSVQVLVNFNSENGLHFLYKKEQYKLRIYSYLHSSQFTSKNQQRKLLTSLTGSVFLAYI